MSVFGSIAILAKLSINPYRSAIEYQLALFVITSLFFSFCSRLTNQHPKAQVRFVNSGIQVYDTASWHSAWWSLLLMMLTGCYKGSRV